MTSPGWSVAIFSSREDAETLRRTVDAVLAASAARVTTIDLLIDSNEATAEALSQWTPPWSPTALVRLWLVPWKDKACAWNRYVHEMAPPAEVAFFVDGYVRPAPGSFALLARALAERPETWAASAVPSVGRSAPALRAALQREGGLHGNLYALPRRAVEDFRSRGFRLPLGLYRNDSLIGAVAAFAGAPASTNWDPLRRIAVVASATWDNDVPPVGIDRVRRYFKRRLRQAQGDLENAAVHQHLAVERRTPESLPRSIDALLAGRPPVALTPRGPVGRMLMRHAAREVASNVDWSRCASPARLLRSWPDP